jgi:hydroxymethylpyrimidine/phosphomethylpyrimidine kinase
MSQSSPPTVLIVAGNDPSGGAGVAADLQTVTALGGHPAPVITALTVQDTRNATAVVPADADLVVDQIRAVLEDQTVAAVKIGLLASAAIARAVAHVLAETQQPMPVVLDPVLVAAGGAALAEQDLERVLVNSLMPLASIVTPNAHEIRALAPDADTPEDRARRLLESGCGFVLAKGGDEPSADVENVLYGADGTVRRWTWSRLPHEYHGSGCTLAAAIATGLARGRSPGEAVDAAQIWTQAALAAAFRPGRGQHVPLRTAAPAR